MQISSSQNVARLVERNVVYRMVYSLFTFHLTPAGQALFWILLVSTSISLFSFIVRAYVLWCSLISICLISIIFSRLGRVRLEVEVNAPDRVRCDQEFEISIHALNATKKASRNIRLHFWLPSGLSPKEEVRYIPQIDPGRSASFAQSVHPTKRGAYLLNHLLQESCYPFGLWRDSFNVKFEQTILVYPSYHPLRELELPVSMRYQPGGIALTSYLGDSTEFMATREFRSGDPIRHIHWRSWARLGKPIVKEYGEEYFCRLALVIDTVLPQPTVKSPLESSISLAAAITDYLSRQEYVIDLFAAGPKLYYLQAGRSLAYLQNIMDLLACLECTPPDDESFIDMQTALLEEIEGISTAICIFTVWDLARADLVQKLKERGTSVLGFLITDDATQAQELPESVRLLPPALITNGIDVL